MITTFPQILIRRSPPWRGRGGFLPLRPSPFTFPSLFASLRKRSGHLLKTSGSHLATTCGASGIYCSACDCVLPANVLVTASGFAALPGCLTTGPFCSSGEYHDSVASTSHAVLVAIGTCSGSSSSHLVDASANSHAASDCSGATQCSSATFMVPNITWQSLTATTFRIRFSTGSASAFTGAIAKGTNGLPCSISGIPGLSFNGVGFEITGAGVVTLEAA